MEQKDSKLAVVKIVIEIIVGIFVIISGVWGALYLFFVKPQAARIVQLENKIGIVESQKNELNAQLIKYKNLMGEANSILPPTWINIPGGARILGGKGMLSLSDVGHGEIFVDLSLPKSAWLNSEGATMKGSTMQFAAGNRFVFTYHNNRYAVDLLALETNRAQLSVVVLK